MNETLYTAAALTSGDFTTGIEGPACDNAGNIYCVSWREPQNIGVTTPSGKSSLFVSLPQGSSGNGIRFDKSGTMFIADYTGHNILKVDMRSRKVSVFAHQVNMNQPNDIAMAHDGTLYASDPSWKNSTGNVWRITRTGQTVLEAGNMGTTNGIEVSVDGRTLYVNESVQRNIWAFTIKPDGALVDKRIFKTFDDFGFDGMRTDVDGNLYVTRHGKGTVVKLSPSGAILREIDVLGLNPTNICFGGPDGCTAFVTEAEKMRLVQFRVERPGFEWRRWSKLKR